MELTLIRSGWLPDQTSDVGTHEFTYAILPHCGDWQQGNVIAAGQALNQPLAVAPAAGERCSSEGLAEVEGGVLSNLKRAETGDGTILRVYQPTAQTGELTIRCKQAVSRAEETDMLENAMKKVEMIDGCIHMTLKPYEIKTIKIYDK